MSSSRLPGKVLAPILDRPMIHRQVERLRRARRLDDLIVATSTEPSDDPLADYAAQQGWAVHRGALADVLDRFAGAVAQVPHATTIVRLTADCPLADPDVIDRVIEAALQPGVDYANNTDPERTFPHGLDAEAMSRDALMSAAREAADPYEREHVTPFIYRRPGRFTLASVQRNPSLAHLRWTVDYPADLDFVREVYGRLYPTNPAFTSEDVAALDVNSSRGGQ